MSQSIKRKASEGRQRRGRERRRERGGGNKGDEIECPLISIIVKLIFLFVVSDVS